MVDDQPPLVLRTFLVCSLYFSLGRDMSCMMILLYFGIFFVSELQQNTDTAAMTGGEHGYYVNSGTSQMDAFSFHGSGPFAGSMRRTQTHHPQSSGARCENSSSSCSSC
jgi:hypothetical protein